MVLLRLQRSVLLHVSRFLMVYSYTAVELMKTIHLIKPQQELVQFPWYHKRILSAYRSQVDVGQVWISFKILHILGELRLDHRHHTCCRSSRDELYPISDIDGGIASLHH